ncbi:hypothetical protein AA313_de0209270 [Arthrobotrys entomopaga]|nr:hypothetical protein AA313_de0209270 [Arthrobotrys entomopaga]
MPLGISATACNALKTVYTNNILVTARRPGESIAMVDGQCYLEGVFTEAIQGPYPNPRSYVTGGPAFTDKFTYEDTDLEWCSGIYEGNSSSGNIDPRKNPRAQYKCSEPVADQQSSFKFELLTGYDADDFLNWWEDGGFCDSETIGDTREEETEVIHAPVIAPGDGTTPRIQSTTPEPESQTQEKGDLLDSLWKRYFSF